MLEMRAVTKTSTKRAFRHGLFEASFLLKKEGLKKPFFEFAPLLVMKLISELKAEQKPYPQKLAGSDWEGFSQLEPTLMLTTFNQSILPALIKAYNPHTDFFLEKSSIRKPEILKKLVDRLSNLNLLTLDSDVLGDAFEFFLEQTRPEHKSSLGVYFTPQPVVKLILDLIDIKANDKIYDPTCGAGGFLTAAFKRQAKLLPQKENNKKTIFGREISDSIKVAKLSLLMAGANPNGLCQMDTLKTPVRGQFSVVLANFPFSQKTHYGSLYGFEGKDANPSFLKHIIDALRPGGVAAVIVPDRLLFHETVDYLKIRKLLLESCQILGIIQCHEYVFMPYTKQPTQVLIFKKGGHTKKVWFFDLSGGAVKKSASLAARDSFPMLENDLRLLKNLWKNKQDSEHSFSVKAQTIVKENYHLSLNRYKRLGKSFKNGVKLGEVCDIVVGETPRKSNPHFYGGKHLFVRIKDLNQTIVKRTDSTLTDACIQKLRIKPLKKNTLLFSLRFSIGRVSWAGKKLYTSEGVAGLIPKDNRVLAGYLYYILPQLDYSPYINRNVKGPELRVTTLAVIQIPLPSLQVQKKLIRALENQEAKRQAYLKLIQKIMLFKQKKIQALI